MSEIKTLAGGQKQPDPRLQTAATKLRGTTIIRRKANQRIAAAATAEALRVCPDDVKASLFDDRGDLGIEVRTPLRQDDVLRCAVLPQVTLESMMGQARQRIAERLTKVAGVKVGKVNIVLAGIKATPETRGLQ